MDSSMKSGYLLLACLALNYGIFYSGAVYIEAYPKDQSITLAIGDTQELKCEIKGCKKTCDVYNISWVKEWSLILEGEKLLLDNVTVDSAGQYTCRLIPVPRKPHHKVFSLEIVAPYIETTPNGAIAVDGGVTVELECQLKQCGDQGCDAYQMEWYKEGSPLGGVKENKLTLEDVSCRDSGQYTCSTFYNQRQYEGNFDVHVEAQSYHDTNTPLMKLCQFRVTGNKAKFEYQPGECATFSPF